MWEESANETKNHQKATRKSEVKTHGTENVKRMTSTLLNAADKVRALSIWFSGEVTDNLNSSILMTLLLRGGNKTRVGWEGSGAGRNKWTECCKFVFEFGHGDEEQGSSELPFF